MGTCVTSRRGRKIALATDEVTGVAAGVFLKVVLMFFFGGVEFRERFEGGDHGAGPAPRGVYVFDEFFGLFLFIVIGVENSGAVAFPDVVSLAVSRGGVVDAEKEVEEALEAGLRRIVRHA